MNFRKFRKSAKALSPVIATIILIAVTVAVSVVVAAWMGALTIGFMGNSEQAKVTNAVLTNTYNSPTDLTGGTTSAGIVTIQNTGSATVTISSVTIDGNTAKIADGYLSGTTVKSLLSNGQVPIAKGTSVDVYITLPATATPFVNSAQYTIALMTSKGNTITTSASYNGP
ncbi:MAG: archaellin/type IV pilin N-terminal domain-containing protein [Candidatus Bathyarchaeia archaeon]